MLKDLYPALGQPAESPGRLALITVMRSLEDLSDRQAAEAVPSRIDWKKRLVTCPNGKTSARCSERETWRGTSSFTLVFAKEDCLPCPFRERRSRAKNVGRTLILYLQEKYEAQLEARQQTEAFEKFWVYLNLWWRYG